MWRKGRTERITINDDDNNTRCTIIVLTFVSMNDLVGTNDSFLIFLFLFLINQSHNNKLLVTNTHPRKQLWKQKFERKYFFEFGIIKYFSIYDIIICCTKFREINYFETCQWRNYYDKLTVDCGDGGDCLSQMRAYVFCFCWITFFSCKEKNTNKMLND